MKEREWGMDKERDSDRVWEREREEKEKETEREREGEGERERIYQSASHKFDMDTSKTIRIAGNEII